MVSLTQSQLSASLDGATKGLPIAEAPVALDAVASRGWNVVRGDLPMPVLMMNDGRFIQNLRSMRRLAESLGLSIAPHGKTPMAPSLFEDYVREGGAWGVSVASVQQAVVAAAGGAPHVLIANQVIGRANIEGLAALRAAFPDKGFACFVDSAEALVHLVRFGKDRLAGGDRFDILIEVGAMGARTGARTVGQIEAIIGAARQHAVAVRVVGVACYEGAISRSDAEETRRAIDSYLAFAVDTFNRAAATGLFVGLDEAILTGGGSVWFDRVAAVFAAATLDHPARRVLRCGSYPFMDHRLYRSKLDAIDVRGGLPGLPPEAASARKAFAPSLELWSAVQSVREPGRAIVTMGRRDLPFDQGLPIPLRQYRDGALMRVLPEDEAANPFVLLKVDDQHAYLSFPEGEDVQVGDLFAFGISHPCTAFDKWRVVFRVDDDFNVTGAVQTFF